VSRGGAETSAESSPVQQDSDFFMNGGVTASSSFGATNLDYTILRPGWFTHDDEVAYQLTQKGEPFKGHDVSLNSLSDLIVKLALTPGMEIRRSLGVSRPATRTIPGSA